MNDEEIRHGSTVWIKNGLNKGRKGTVVTKGFGSVSVVLEGETKVFILGDVTTKNPAHTVPLPPNFIPADYEIGDLVEVSGHPNGTFNGIEGKITRLPTSTSYSNGGDKRYEVEVTVPNGSIYPAGTSLYFEPKVLKKAVQKPRIEGNTIKHEDVIIGDTIRVELRSSKGSYSQLSTKEGKVNAISTKLNHTNLAAYEHYQFRTSNEEGGYMLNYGHKDEKIFLVKAAEDPWKAIVAGLTSGTVVVRENDNGSVSVFVKAPPSMGSSQWHVMNSLSTRSSSFVTDSDILRILNEGNAEFVHKVRKPVPVPF